MNEPPFPDGVPKLSDDAVVCRFNGFGGQPKSVIMDRATRMIHFQNCHVPSTFLPVAAQPWFSSPFNGLIAAHEYRRRKGKREPLGLIIVTHAGKATIPTDATNYELLRERMVAYSGNFGKDDPEVFGGFDVRRRTCWNLPCMGSDATKRFGNHFHTGDTRWCIRWVPDTFRDLGVDSQK